MSSLVIDLQVGFADDTVELFIDGLAVLRQRVTTDYSIGRADSVRVDPDGGVITLEVRILSRDIGGRVSVDIGETPYVGVSVEDDTLVFRKSGDMFVYF